MSPKFLLDSTDITWPRKVAMNFSKHLTLHFCAYCRPGTNNSCISLRPQTTISAANVLPNLKACPYEVFPEESCTVLTSMAQWKGGLHLTKRFNSPKQRRLHPNPRTCGCAVSYGRRDSADGMRLKISRWRGYFRVSGWPQYNHQGSFKSEAGGLKSEEMCWKRLQSEGEMWGCSAAGFADGKPPKAGNAGALQMLTARRTFLPKEHSPASTLISGLLTLRIIWW